MNTYLPNALPIEAKQNETAEAWTLKNPYGEQRVDPGAWVLRDPETSYSWVMSRELFARLYELAEDLPVNPPPAVRTRRTTPPPTP